MKGWTRGRRGGYRSGGGGGAKGRRPGRWGVWVEVGGGMLECNKIIDGCALSPMVHTLLPLRLRTHQSLVQQFLAGGRKAGSKLVFYAQSTSSVISGRLTGGMNDDFFFIFFFKVRFRIQVVVIFGR